MNGLALDTDVLIPWLVESNPGHAVARRLVAHEIQHGSGKIVMTPQVCWEFLHVVTDERRYALPLSMPDASLLIRTVWNARETQRLLPTGTVLPRVLEWMTTHSLGRKRILDTAVVATLERGGVRRLATFNRRDFACFDFLEIVDPAAELKPEYKR